MGRLTRLPLIVTLTTLWRSPEKLTISPAPPFAHGTNERKLTGVLVFVIVVFPACAAVTLARTPSMATASTANRFRITVPPLCPPLMAAANWAGRSLVREQAAVYR